MEKKRKKLGLALGGGGARGFCHVGVLQVLEENNIQIDCISGCSMGAVVGGCYCAGIDLDRMSSMIAKFNQRQIMDIDITLRHLGILKGNRAMMFIKKLIGDKQIEECNIPFAATAVDIKQAELITFTSGSLADSIRASFAIPVAFATAACGDKACLVDGGIIERVPINAAKQLGAEIVIAVDALGPPEPVEEIKGVLDMITRSYLILDWENCKRKLKEADLIITPNQPDNKMLVFKNNMDSVKAGRQACIEALPKILELIQ